MKIRTNTFKARMKGAQKSYGIWHGIPHVYVAEICAGAGFDWICIDAEHSPFSFDSILNNMLAIQSHDVPTIIRIPSADPVLIKQLLDAGAQNILAPMIESADQAELMVKAMLYPPAGIRGVGTGLARAAQWDRVHDYFQQANEEMCSMVQVESVKGIEALDEILEIAELDVVFIGPADLAASMGYLGKSGHPEVVKLVVQSIEKIRQSGKAAGFLTGSKELIQKYEEAGALMLGVGADSMILAKATQHLAETFMPHLKGIESNTSY